MAHCSVCGHHERVHDMSQDKDLHIYCGKCNECDCPIFTICECVVCNATDFVLYEPV